MKIAHQPKRVSNLFDENENDLWWQAQELLERQQWEEAQLSAEENENDGE